MAEQEPEGIYVPIKWHFPENIINRYVNTVPPLPTPQILLFGNIAPGWEISQPLLATLERDDDGCYIASDDQFAVYGDGDTPLKALQDYVESLIDYYQLLATRAEDDPPTEALFRRLQLYLHPAVE